MATSTTKIAMDNDLIIGLAGHIDHGKTSLIKALNGFDGDSAKQEKERGITLDISFSELKTPSRQIALIDVPGHHKLIKNMIAGAFGIDVLLLVVACDDGVMPQSIEHLQIANFLGIKHALCVLSKADLCPDKAHLEKLKIEVLQLFAGFDSMLLHDILPFSTKFSQTHSNLITALDTLPKPHKNPAGFFRYYIDRSFSLKGIGSVVSGSVVSGSITQSQKVFVCELGSELTIRGLQMHGRSVEHATPSHRVAINLANIPHTELERGYLLTQKGFMRGFDCIDVVLDVLSEENLHNKTLQFFIGAKRCSVKVIILGHSSSEPSRVFATLKSETKIFAIFKERFILRDEERNIAGGMVLNPITDPIKKSQKLALLEALLREDYPLAFGIESSAHKRGFGLISSQQRFCLEHERALDIARTIPHSYLDEKNLVLYHHESLEFLKSEILRIMEKNPTALLSAKALNLRLSWASEGVLDFVLEELLAHELIAKKTSLYTSKNNQIKDLESFVRDKIFEALMQGHLTPQAPYNIYDALDLDRKMGDNALKKLCASQKVHRLEHNLFVPSVTLQNIVAEMRALINKHGFVNLEILREHWGISRKYLVAYLDYLDCFEDIANEQGKRTLRYKAP